MIRFVCSLLFSIFIFSMVLICSINHIILGCLYFSLFSFAACLPLVFSANLCVIFIFSMLLLCFITYDEQGIIIFSIVSSIVPLICIILNKDRFKELSRRKKEEQERRRRERESEVARKRAEEIRRQAEEELSRRRREEARRQYEEQERIRREEDARRRREEQERRERESRQNQARGNDVERAFAVFELPTTATFAEVKAKRVLLLKFFHPDHHDSDSAAASYATEKTKQINDAYEILRNYFK